MLSGDAGGKMSKSVPRSTKAAAMSKNKMLNKHGFSGGNMPTRPDTKKQYPLTKTAAVVNMR